METSNRYELPELNFGFSDLAPFLSEDQLAIHYQKHHQAYVNAANTILDKIEKARKENADYDIKAMCKDLSFQVGGHIMHSLFWKNLAPTGKGGGEPGGMLGAMIKKDFGDFARFKKEFTQCAISTEGSGWASVVYCDHTDQLLLMQVEKHNVNVFPGHKIILVLDVFEHAYYLDYKNDRAKYVEAFWNCINWEQAEKRMKNFVK